MKRIDTRIIATALIALITNGCSGSSDPDRGPPEPAPPPPTTVQISIAGAAMDEGDAGVGALIFPVVLSAAAGSDVTVSYATSDGTAASTQDYDAASGVLSIAAGSTSGEISVPVTGDTLIESDETFVLTLSNPSPNATISTATATGTLPQR